MAAGQPPVEAANTAERASTLGLWSALSAACISTAAIQSAPLALAVQVLAHGRLTKQADVYAFGIIGERGR